VEAWQLGKGLVYPDIFLFAVKSFIRTVVWPILCFIDAIVFHILENRNLIWKSDYFNY